jgi:transcriptional regulator with XRE-family HTH domain
METRPERIRRGLTQQELAVLAGVSSVARWENERDPVTPGRLHSRALARALGVSVDYLMHGEENPMAPPSAPPAPPVVIEDRRQPGLASLRDIIARVQAAGDEALEEFVRRVEHMARGEAWMRPHGRK